MDESSLHLGSIQLTVLAPLSDLVSPNSYPQSTLNMKSTTVSTSYRMSWSFCARKISTIPLLPIPAPRFSMNVNVSSRWMGTDPDRGIFDSSGKWSEGENLYGWSMPSSTELCISIFKLGLWTGGRMGRGMHCVPEWKWIYWVFCSFSTF